MSAPNTKAYLQTKVMTANPAELKLMLLDGAIRFAQNAHDALTKHDHEATYLGITKCQAILLELINALRPEHDPSLCQKLSALYTFMYTQLMSANSQRDPAIVDEVLKLLRFERDTWSMLLDQLAAENRAAANAMNNAPEVKPNIPASTPCVGSLIGGMVSMQG